MKGQYRGFASGNLAPTCLLPRPAACSNPTGICTIGYIFLCGPLRARAPCFSVYASLSSFLRIFFHGVIARRPGYATSGKIFDGARTSFAYSRFRWYAARIQPSSLVRSRLI